jgi:membrane protein implicated in regulation of membrane protease activity
MQKSAGFERRRILLSISALACGSISTLLGGSAAAVGKALFAAGASGWQITCGVVALFSLFATIINAVLTQSNLARKLEITRGCARKLAKLEAGLISGGQDEGQVRRELAEVMLEYETELA